MIKTKYIIDQEVYLLRDNKAVKGIICGIEILIGTKYFKSGSVQIADDKGTILYYIKNSMEHLSEKEIFLNRDELIEHIFSTENTVLGETQENKKLPF